MTFSNKVIATLEKLLRSNHRDSAEPPSSFTTIAHLRPPTRSHHQPPSSFTDEFVILSSFSRILNHRRTSVRTTVKLHRHAFSFRRASHGTESHRRASHFTDRASQILFPLSLTQLLDLSHCKDVSEEGIVHVLMICCNIRHLNLTRCSRLKLHTLNFEVPKLEVNLKYCDKVLISRCLAARVFTPYYSETVLYSTSELQKENEDGISTLFYLQKIFPELNFALFTQKNTNTMLYFGIFKGTMTTTQSYSNETRLLPHSIDNDFHDKIVLCIKIVNIMKMIADKQRHKTKEIKEKACISHVQLDDLKEKGGNCIG
ncbi:glucan synthase-like protein [Medicago truncatula]|uniref:Glucan synthase-like protein n=1 Tax=Medicago truncatula TaxID=3880 RepID=G7LHT8_MEDTR|nr:glucan synthase-like protein [Medicago truncatula]